MYITDSVRNAIWQNSARGTIICHPPKTGGLSLYNFYARLLGDASTTIELLRPSEISEFENKRLKAEEKFVNLINQRKEWAIKFGHQKYSTEQLLDFPTFASLLMPYRPLLIRIKSWLAFNYRFYTQMGQSSLRLSLEGIELTTSGEIPTFSYLGQKISLGNTFENKFILKDLSPELAIVFASNILESEKYLQLLEKGEVDFFLNNINSLNFFYRDILGNLLLNNQDSRIQLRRITFIDSDMINLYITSKYKKSPPPRVNVSNYSNLPNALKNRIQGKEFERKIRSLFYEEFIIEEELKSRLWVGN